MSEPTAAIWPALWQGERVPAEFDFAAELPFGDVIQTVDVSVVLLKGVDASPAALLDGAAQIKGGRVFQWLQADVPGCSYRVVCRATSSFGRVILLAGVLAVNAF